MVSELVQSRLIPCAHFLRRYIRNYLEDIAVISG